MKPGRIPAGQPGGHIGWHLLYCCCTKCGKEWVYNGSGLPTCMSYCLHEDKDIVTVSFEAKWHGRLGE